MTTDFRNGTFIHQRLLAFGPKGRRALDETKQSQRFLTSILHRSLLGVQKSPVHVVASFSLPTRKGPVRVFHRLAPCLQASAVAFQIEAGRAILEIESVRELLQVG